MIELLLFLIGLVLYVGAIAIESIREEEEYEPKGTSRNEPDTGAGKGHAQK